jgi:hypothetical protein
MMLNEIILEFFHKCIEEDIYLKISHAVPFEGGGSTAVGRGRGRIKYPVIRHMSYPIGTHLFRHDVSSYN